MGTFEKAFGWTNANKEILEKADGDLKNIFNILVNVHSIYLCGGGYSDIVIHLSESKSSTIEGLSPISTFPGRFINLPISNSPKKIICGDFQFSIITCYGKKIALITDGEIKVEYPAMEPQTYSWYIVMKTYIEDHLRSSGYCGNINNLVDQIFTHGGCSKLVEIFLNGYGINFMKNGTEFFMNEFKQFMSMKKMY